LRAVAADFARAGVRLFPPHVHHSGYETTLEEGAVRVGLGAIHPLSERTRMALIEGRPFADLRDLLTRVPLSRRERQSLILSGACDGLAPLDPASYPFAHEEALARLERDADPAVVDQVSPAPADDRVPIYRSLVRVRNELRHLGMHLSDHPMRLLRTEAERAGCIPTVEAGA